MGTLIKLEAGSREVRPTNEMENWYKEVTGGEINKRVYTYIAGKWDGGIKALVLYSDYTGHSISMDICAPRALTRNLIYTMFDYPFNQLKVKRLFGLIDSRNILSQRTFFRLGCREVSRIPNFFGEGIDRLVYEATKEDVAKWVS